MENKPRFGRPKPFTLGVIINDQNGAVEVTRVVDDSIAANAGIQANDIIVAIGDEEISRRVQLNRIIKRDRGKTVMFKLKREDTEVTLEVELKNGDE